MSLKFSWKLNTATTDDPDDYYPQVTQIDYANDENLISDIAIPGSILKETELRAVTLRVFQQLTHYIENGRGFKNQFIILKPALGGKTYAEDTAWDDDKFSKHAHALLREPFQEAAQRMKVQRINYIKEAPVIENVYDRKSNTTNNMLTPGYSLRINGEQLKIHQEPAGQGVFLVNINTGAEILLEIEDNFPAQLRVDIPDNLQAGTYHLKVVNTKRNDAKTLRTTIYEMPLTVA